MVLPRIAGDINVFEHTPAVTKIYLDNVKCTGMAFYSPLLLGSLDLAFLKRS
jgi:hypothetical protein